MDGNLGQFDIQATRRVLSAELKRLLGEWEFSLSGDDGIERRPVLKLSEENGQLAASLSDNGEVFDLQNVRFENGVLSFNFSRNHEGMQVDIRWTCKPEGNRMTGSLQYDADGNTGEIPLTGQRKS